MSSKNSTQHAIEKLLSKCPVAVAMFDRNMKYICWSDRWAKDFGLEPAKLSGKSHYEIFPEISKNWKKLHRDGFRGIASASQGDLFVRGDGREQWIRWALEPWRNSKNEVAGIIIYSEDITEHRINSGKSKLALMATAEALARVLEARDPYTHGHMAHVVQLASAIAIDMNLRAEQIEAISLAAAIHDVGKIYVPSEILNRPGKLSITQFELVKEHAKIGYEIIKDIDFNLPIGRIVIEHHERLDGSGYPNALEGGDILLESQVVAVADVVDAMCSHRPYRPALGIEAALDVIKESSGSHFDPSVCTSCVGIIERHEFAFRDDYASFWANISVAAVT